MSVYSLATLFSNVFLLLLYFFTYLHTHIPFFWHHWLEPVSKHCTVSFTPVVFGARGLKMNFLLIQPQCQIYKMLFGESIPSPEHSTVDKLLQTVTSQAEALQNSETEIQLIPDL